MKVPHLPGARRATLLLPLLLAAQTGLSACQAAPQAAGPAAWAPAGTGRVALHPSYRAGAARALLALVAPRTLASIHHMVIEIFTWDGTTEALQGTLDVQAPDLLNTITFGNLKNDTTYRIRAYAYETAGLGDLISVNASSYVDVAVGADDRPVVGNLVVQLADVAFSGQATAAGISVTPGALTYPDAVGVAFTLPSGVTTLAGGASVGFINQTGGAAAFEQPTDIALGPDDVFYVADAANHAIRMVTPGGVVTTLAGDNTAGTADGAAGRFNGPTGIAVAASGDVYVADTLNHLIRKVTPAGVVSTLAGSGVAAFANGSGAGASFSGPTGLAIDPATGDLYVADAGNQRIRKVTPGGVVSTFAGSGAAGVLNATGLAATFDDPRDLAFTLAGDLLVADRGNHLIRRITPGAVVTTLAGDGLAGTIDNLAGSARFDSPSGIAVDPGTNEAYVSDQGSHKLRRIALADAQVTTLAGSTAGFADAAAHASVKFDLPAGLALRQGLIYLADVNNHRIRRVVAPVPS